jgi:hypothetical protein
MFLSLIRPSGGRRWEMLDIVTEQQPLRWCSFALPVVQQVGHFGTSTLHLLFQNLPFGMSLAVSEFAVVHFGSEEDPFVACICVILDWRSFFSSACKFILLSASRILFSKMSFVFLSSQVTSFATCTSISILGSNSPVSFKCIFCLATL